MQPSRSIVSLLSIFVLGFIIEALVMRDLLAVNTVGAGALGLAPIAIFYIRKAGQL